jgi:hypothetical protein
MYNQALKDWSKLPKKQVRRYGRKEVAEMALDFWSKRTPHKDGWILSENNGVWTITPYDRKIQGGTL